MTSFSTPAARMRLRQLAMIFGVCIAAAAAMALEVVSVGHESLGVNGDIGNGVLSLDARYVTYAVDSTPTSFVVRDLGTDTSSFAPPLPPYSYWYGDLTPSGRYSLFTSPSALVAGDTNAVADVFVYDTVSTAMERISVSTAGAQHNGSFAGHASISADGRFVSFHSNANNLVAGDSTGDSDVFVRDRCVSEGAAVPSCTPSTQRISLGTTGAQVDGWCYAGRAGMSADGRFVTFMCYVRNREIFTPGFLCDGSPISGCFAAFVRDRCMSGGTTVPACTTHTTLASVTADGHYLNEGGGGLGGLPIISPNGNRLAFSNDGTLGSDVYLAEWPGLMNQIIALGYEPYGSSWIEHHHIPVSMSADGQRVLIFRQAAYDYYGSTRELVLWTDCNNFTYTCNDGERLPGCEVCDDGNAVEGDGCDSNCTLTACGNGIKSAGEGCDDGNTIDGDGCDSNCTPTGCGNSIQTAGEACDDGDVVAGDGCSPTCQAEPNSLTPGGGSAKTDCYHEWMPRPGPGLLDPKGLPKNIMDCHDGDASCDADGTVNQICTFSVRSCLNLLDTRRLDKLGMPACTPLDVASIEIITPKRHVENDSDNAPPTDYTAVDQHNMLTQTLGSSFAANFEGHCTKPPLDVGLYCIDHSDCDESDDGGDGRCSRPKLELATPIADIGRCSASMSLRVPLNYKRGLQVTTTRKIKLKITPTVNPLNGKARPADVDVLKLICRPAV